MAYLLHDLLRNSASDFPDQPALIGPKRKLSYRELDLQSDAVARVLVGAGVLPGMPVGIAMHKCIDAVVAVYGIMKAGGCYVPIDAFAPSQRSVGIVSNTEMTHIVTTADRVSTLIADFRAQKHGSSLKTIITVGEKRAEAPSGLRQIDWQEGVTPETQLPALTGTHLAYVLHTSGSTGVPKGVAISHSSALCFVNSAREFWKVSSADRLCSQAPLHFDLSVFDIYVAAQAGAAVVLIPEYYAAFPKKMAATVDAQGITIWNSVVSTLTLMMERGKPETCKFETLRLVIFSGEVMPVRYLRILHQHMTRATMYNVYGQTEANSSMFYRVDREAIPEDDNWKIPLGRSLPNFEVYSLDDAGRKITDPGIPGELFVRANAVASGYWSNPTLSANAFILDPLDPESGARVFRTGDLVQLDEKGHYVFCGRSDNMIKSRGYRVELGDIDLALLSCPGVESAAAVALADDEIGNRLFAFATLAEGSELTSTAILTHCQERLPKYMIPESVELRSDLPRTSTNKIDRKFLQAELREARVP